MLEILTHYTEELSLNSETTSFNVNYHVLFHGTVFPRFNKIL